MSKLTALIGFILLAVSSAWAQTPAPTSPAPGAPPGSPPAGDAAATGSGIVDYWWIILLVVIVAAAIWYFSRSRGRNRNQL
jgi:heme/copper-type cytochrome/quinol oxidase subunit 2